MIPLLLLGLACPRPATDSEMELPEVCDEPEFGGDFLPRYFPAACVYYTACVSGYHYTEEELEDCTERGWDLYEYRHDSRNLMDGMCDYGCEFADQCIADLEACVVIEGEILPHSCIQTFDYNTSHVNDDCDQPLE